MLYNVVGILVLKTASRILIMVSLDIAEKMADQESRAPHRPNPQQLGLRPAKFWDSSAWNDVDVHCHESEVCIKRYHQPH